MAMFGTLDPNSYASQFSLAPLPADLAQAQQQPMAPAAPAQQQQPSMGLGGGDKGSRIADALGLLGGGIARAGGGQDVYTPMLEQRRQLQWQMGKQAQQQQLEYMRQLGLEQYKQQAGLIGQDDFTRALLQSGLQPGSDQWKALAAKRADMLTNPVQMVSDGMGGMYAVRPNSVGASASAAPSGPPVAAVDYLRKNPNLAAAFDQKYGQGASAAILGNTGGPAASPPATFP